MAADYSPYIDYNMQDIGKYMECKHGIRKWTRARDIYNKSPCLVCKKIQTWDKYVAVCTVSTCQKGRLKVCSIILI